MKLFKSLSTCFLLLALAVGGLSACSKADQAADDVAAIRKMKEKEEADKAAAIKKGQDSQKKDADDLAKKPRW